jgi:hypothetical protein
MRSGESNEFRLPGYEIRCFRWRRPSVLARRFFALLRDKDYDGLDAFLDADVVFAPMMFPGRVYRGHDDVLRGFYDIVLALPEYRPEAARFTDLTHELALVKGRVHFVDRRGSLHDKSAYWVIAFKDEKLVLLEGKGSLAAARERARAIDRP